MPNSKEIRYKNSLIKESSPYLLQHADNPVDWYPWNEKALDKARKEDKLLLISIGYSACHWCHVMENESFEDEEVAKIMNDNFICIKVDREERPDIDQIYMAAVHLMNQRGGWPLNCIALPDGRPFWGGTYFRKEDWKNQILSLSKLYKDQRKTVIEFAEKLKEGISQVELVVKNKEEKNFSFNDLDKTLTNWTTSFDTIDGGVEGAPKFPMPNAYSFLLKYGHFSNNNKILDHVRLTLDKIAFGGIYDQIGGGFSRYSVDQKWKVPHFEKMLYDNAQLVSLYSEAFLKFREPIYKEIVFETLDFVERELYDDSGAFYSALDADSEGEEGKFYTWKEEGLKKLITINYQIFQDYYNINKTGFWENGNYILQRKKYKSEIIEKYNITVDELNLYISDWKKILFNSREKRIRPGLDDKSLTSWNALMLKAYIDAYLSFGDEKHLKIAKRNANFIKNKQLNGNGKLWHNYKNGTSSINGFLEDYAQSISAFIRLYEATFELKWLELSERMMLYVLEHFYDSTSSMFFFTSDLDPKLVARKMEVHDNVVPASNSVLANSLFDLGIIRQNNEYKNMAASILNNIKPKMDSYFTSYSNYANLFLKYTKPFYQVVITGKGAVKKIIEINDFYSPNKLFIGGDNSTYIPQLKGKKSNNLVFYICEDGLCKKPTSEINEAINLLR